MTIDKAIEHLNAIKESGEYLGEPDDSRAVQLGIEALKLIQRSRQLHSPIKLATLPGETKELEEEPPTREEVKKFLEEESIKD